MEREGTPILVIFRVLVLIAWIGLALASLYLAIGVPLGSLNARLVPWLGWLMGLWVWLSASPVNPSPQNSGGHSAPA